MKDPAPLTAEAELELITRAQQGERRSFGELVRSHRTGVINVVYRMSGNANLAEDAAQETFIRAWTNLSRYRPRSPFRNWVYRIATNAALDMMRREHETVDFETLALPNPGDGPETVLLAEEREERVRKAVLALPEASRVVLVLREYEGLSYRDIADALRIPIGTVMSRLNYARNRLRQLLALELEEL